MCWPRVVAPLLIIWLLVAQVGWQPPESGMSPFLAVLARPVRVRELVGAEVLPLGRLPMAATVLEQRVALRQVAVAMVAPVETGPMARPEAYRAEAGEAHPLPVEHFPAVMAQPAK